MVVGAGVRPIGFQIFEIEVEALHRRLAAVDDVHRTLPQTDGSQTRRSAQTFLAGAVANVDVPIVHADVMASQGGDRIYDHQSVVLVSQLNGLGQRRECTRGGLRVDHSDHLDSGMLLEFVGQGLNVGGLAPRGIHHNGIRPAPAGDVGQAISKKAIAADNCRISRLQDIGAGCFHGSSACGRQG